MYVLIPQCYYALPARPANITITRNFCKALFPTVAEEVAEEISSSSSCSCNHLRACSAFTIIFVLLEIIRKWYDIAVREETVLLETLYSYSYTLIHWFDSQVAVWTENRMTGLVRWKLWVAYFSESEMTWRRIIWWIGFSFLWNYIKEHDTIYVLVRVNYWNLLKRYHRQFSFDAYCRTLISTVWYIAHTNFSQTPACCLKGLEIIVLSESVSCPKAVVIPLSWLELMQGFGWLAYVLRFTLASLIADTFVDTTTQQVTKI